MIDEIGLVFSPVSVFFAGRQIDVVETDCVKGVQFAAVRRDGAADISDAVRNAERGGAVIHFAGRADFPVLDAVQHAVFTRRVAERRIAVNRDGAGRKGKENGSVRRIRDRPAFVGGEDTVSAQKHALITALHADFRPDHAENSVQDGARGEQNEDRRKQYQ